MSTFILKTKAQWTILIELCNNSSSHTSHAEPERQFRTILCHQQHSCRTFHRDLRGPRGRGGGAVRLLRGRVPRIRGRERVRAVGGGLKVRMSSAVIPEERLTL